MCFLSGAQRVLDCRKGSRRDLMMRHPEQESRGRGALRADRRAGMRLDLAICWLLTRWMCLSLVLIVKECIKRRNWRGYRAERWRKCGEGIECFRGRRGMRASEIVRGARYCQGSDDEGGEKALTLGRRCG